VDRAVRDFSHADARLSAPGSSGCVASQEKLLLGLLVGYCLFQIGSQFELDVLNGSGRG
jgi:hypothetical protein